MAGSTIGDILIIASLTFRNTSDGSAVAKSKRMHWSPDPRKAANPSRQAILRYVPADAIHNYEAKLARVREELREAIVQRLGDEL